MKQVKHFLAVMVLAFSTQLIVIGRVDAVPYSFSVDRFQAKGGIFGNFVDEFDDGVLAPWFVDDGTAVEADGVVTLSNPGTVGTPVRIDNLVLTGEESDLVLGILQPADGVGDFQATSTWTPIVPGVNQFFSMRADVDTQGGEDVELVELSVFNVGPLVADAFDITTAGLYVSFSRSDAGTLNGTGLVEQAVSIVEEDVIGDIFLSLVFDDASNQFNAAFSLDGGATFQRPFAPVDSRLGDGIFNNWNLYVGSIGVTAVPEPATLLLLAVGLVGLASLQRKNCLRKVNTVNG